MSKTLETIFDNIGIPVDNINVHDRLIILAIIVAVGLALCYMAKKFLFAVVSRILNATPTKWDDYILNKKVLALLCRLIFPIFLYFCLPIPFAGHPTLTYYILKVLIIYIVVLCVQIMCAALDGAYKASAEEERLKAHPLKGLFQMFKLIAIIIGSIIGVSALLSKSPITILTGLGASAAVLMLVFKDTILGLVAGVQLSVNKMLTVGDWITIGPRGINGVVEEISLTTVKVRNFDNTILTIPPYTLVTETFQNWQGMKESGARRVMRSINIDMNSVHFCSDEEIERISEFYTIPEVDEDRKDGGERINLRLFRLYLEHYLTSHPMVSDSGMIMIRQLQPSSQGLPMELYFFSATTDWKAYEILQSDIFDHVIATVNHFGLRIFQLPSDNPNNYIRLAH